MHRRLGDARGQSTVELALCIPALVIVLGLVVEVGLIASDQARLWHAAREAARVAIVDPDAAEVREAVERAGLDGVEMTIEPEAAYRVQGRPLEVSLTYRPGGHVPLIGEVFGGIELQSAVSMRIEQP